MCKKHVLYQYIWDFLNNAYYYVHFKHRRILKSYKNKHHGERCFIIGNGPSLTIADLECLKNEKTMVANSIIKIFDDLSFTPTYYFAQDATIIKDNADFINNRKNITKFTRAFYNKKRYPLKDTINYIVFSPKIGFSNNIPCGVYNGWAVTYSMIQFAVYMGFSEIYLLGVDFNYTNNNTEVNAACYFDNRLYNNNLAYALPKPEVTLASYQTAREYCKNNNIKIYNATRGGMLEVFDRINFDEIIKK